MTETVAILFIFFLFILFGLLFYFSFERSSFEGKVAQQSVDNALFTSLNALFLPELRCSKGENIPVKDCIDLYKIDAAREHMTKESDYYFDILGFSSLVVQQIYPEPEQRWVVYNKTPENVGRVVNTPLPVALFDPVGRKFSYGVLTVETYS